MSASDTEMRRVLVNREMNLGVQGDLNNIKRRYTKVVIIVTGVYKKK